MFFHFLHYIGGLFLGWGLGANDSANVFGMAVGARMVTWRKAAFFTCIFVIVGAVFQGRAGIETLAHDLSHKAEKDNSYTQKTHIEKSGPIGLVPAKYIKHYKTRGGQENTGQAAQIHSPSYPSNEDPDHPEYEGRQLKNAMIMSFSAALTVAIMTIMKLPVSTSQAVVGAIIGLNLLKGSVRWDGFIKVVFCWITTPVGAVFFTLIFYHFFKYIINKWKPSAIVYDRVMTWLLILTGCYGAYALGANNVANVTAVFVMAGSMTVAQAEWFGGIAIAIGVLTYSKPVMTTVGGDIIRLNAFTAFITVLSLAVTIWIYALVGVPVSSTQAVVGSVLGLGFIKGAHTVNFKTLGKISLGWIATPICGGVFAAGIYFISNLYYMPN